MNESAKPVIAAIEAGGTKVQVAVGTDWDQSAYRTIQTTNDPIETMAQALEAIDECAGGRAIVVSVSRRSDLSTLTPRAVNTGLSA